jgi:hypothetical protein
MRHGNRAESVASACVLLVACSAGSASDARDPARDLAPISTGSKREGASAVAPPDPNSIAAQAVYRDVTAGTVAAQALEFTPDYPLWSDGAEKRRWVSLPADRTIDTSDMDHWMFPVGTKFVKEFSLDGVRLETRVIERVANTGRTKKDLKLSVYVWNEAQTDAQLTTDGVVDVLGTQHDVPKQKDCIACHVGEPSGTLGFSAIQLSESGTLRWLERSGLLSEPPGRVYTIPGSAIERSAIGALHGNCGHCHTEGTPADVTRLRVLVGEIDSPLGEWEIYRTTLNQAVTKWSPRPDGFDVRIVPGDPDASALLYRMESRDSESSVGEQMPPLASELVDSEAVAAVRAWIGAMEPTTEPDSRVDEDATAESADETTTEGSETEETGETPEEAAAGEALDADTAHPEPEPDA